MRNHWRRCIRVWALILTGHLTLGLIFAPLSVTLSGIVASSFMLGASVILWFHGK